MLPATKSSIQPWFPGSEWDRKCLQEVRAFLVLGSPLNISFLFRREDLVGRVTMCIQIAYCNICNKHSSPTKSCKKAPPLKSSTPLQCIYCQMYVCQLKLSRKSKCYVSTGTRARERRKAENGSNHYYERPGYEATFLAALEQIA